jgi:hypothetical protein
MKKQIIAEITVIACVALGAVVWQWNAEVEDLPAEPAKAAVPAEIEARSEEVPHIFISGDMAEPETVVITKDEPEVTAEPVAESELKHAEVTAEEKTGMPAPTPTLKPQATSKYAPASTEPKPGDRKVINGEPHV